MVQGRDGSLYAGTTTDPERRLHEHNHTRRGARWCRGRRPVRLVWLEAEHDHGSALRREAALRRLSRAEKLQLVEQAP